MHINIYKYTNIYVYRYIDIYIYVYIYICLYIYGLFVADGTKCQKSVCSVLCNFSSFLRSTVVSVPISVVLVKSLKEIPYWCL